MAHEHKPLFDEAIQEMLNSLKTEDEMTEKQRRIMEAAIALFAEKGFHASSTSEIARRAGVAEGTIFKHFKTKKDLLYALIGPMFIKFASPLILKDVKQIINEDLPAKEVILKLYRNRLALLEENWPRMRIVLQEALFHPDIMNALLENLVKDARGLAEASVKNRIEQSEFRPLPVKAITRAIFSTMLGYVFFSKAFPDEYANEDKDKDLRDAVDILMYGIANKRPDSL
ncbi:TetR/AcrR family transcriptional regulator [Aneurinibacillus sp. UBA3580]|uniref:TetR/AcrR family transcriptional regulator n=1 Tax=Aneurinibacillus sp. UBA3580 TaxID=1946041 RepID=UPI0025807B1D|nr:TetR/AcrR family transcriptional regulator [Aneurinibacillus sp. UBA3580]